MAESSQSTTDNGLPTTDSCLLSPPFPADVPPTSCYPLSSPSDLMTDRRWLRIIPVALIMYTISYVDRTNISLALDPRISAMMKDLVMDDRMKGEAAGIFF